MRELDELLGLSSDVIDRITDATDGTDKEVYLNLIEVIKEASASNLSQVELRNKIEEMGDVAVKLAKRVTSLAALLR